MDFPLHIPFIDSLGFELVTFEDGLAEIQVRPQPQHHNAFGVAHGGLVMTLLDAVMAHAARGASAAQTQASPGPGPGLVTVEIKTTFMRPAEGCLHAVGRVLHRSATMAFCEGSVYCVDPEAEPINITPQTLAAHATATFKFVRALPVAGRGIKSLSRQLGSAGSD